MKKTRCALCYAVLAVCFALLLAVSVGTGSAALSPHEILRILLLREGAGTAAYNVLLKIRLPRVLAAAVMGGTLSVSGFLLQTFFRNPIAGPYVLGVSSGAAFGAAACIVFSWTFISKGAAAFLFAMLAMALAYGFAFEKEEIPVVRLILSGMIISSVFTALLNFLKVAASDSKLREITFWTMGGFYTSEWKGALRLTVIAVLGLILTCGYGWKLNVLAMGEQECRTLGIHAGRLKLLLIASATFLTASCVAEAGIISWVGLMIPHGARMLIGPDHRYMIPFSALLGGSFLVLCDTLARTLMMGELPVSIVTSILGAPYLIYLLRQNRKVYFE